MDAGADAGDKVIGVRGGFDDGDGGGRAAVGCRAAKVVHEAMPAAERAPPAMSRSRRCSFIGRLRVVPVTSGFGDGAQRSYE